MKSIIIGTAGHIDHGKTALVRALTGIDADRLPEEKRRGITIDLGFADLDLGEARVGFVDVPGHERFVKNMLAGAHGIDAVALVIAADESVMPQTREHFEICRLLGVRQGLVVITKRDLVEEDLLQLVRAEAQELVAGSFLENAPIVAVSSRTGEGIEDLKQTLREIASQVPARSLEFVTRLPIDRSFTMRGFGAVVTGTLVAGEIAEGDELELLPDGTRVRVRGVQVHGSPVQRAVAGQRTAINLGGKPAASGFAQLRLESPVVGVLGDRFIVRSYSPSRTIGGGQVLDAFAGRHRRIELSTARARLEALARGDHATQLAMITESTQRRGLSRAEAAARTGWRDEIIKDAADQALAGGTIANAEGVLISREGFDELKRVVMEEVAAHHKREPLSRGLAKEVLRERHFGHSASEVFRAVLTQLDHEGALVAEKEIVRLREHTRQLSDSDEHLREHLERIYRDAALEPPTVGEAFARAEVVASAQQHGRKLLQLLFDSGALVRVQGEMFFHRNALDDLTKKLREYASRKTNQTIDVAAFKELAGISRKYAIPLLEYLDRQRITRRDGDRRLIL